MKKAVAKDGKQGMEPLEHLTQHLYQSDAYVQPIAFQNLPWVNSNAFPFY